MGKLTHTLTLALAISSGWLPIPLFSQPGHVTVVYTSEAGPYTEALDGLRSTIFAGASQLTTVDLHSPKGPAELATSLQPGSSHLIISIGGDALAAVIEHKTDVPLVATMIMRSEQPGAPRLASAIHLDIPVADILAELKNMFPQKTRIAVIRNPAVAGQFDNSALARARQQGFTVQVADCRNPEELLRAVRSFKGQVDFVVCLPDSILYNGTTVKPLILASLECHLLIVGFSQSFVRAGAAIGVYPDFRDVGAQTGEIAQRQLAGQIVAAEEGPRKLVVAVNQRVIRLLGVEYEPRRGKEVVTLR
jgi:putative tryptophan/tyrosine transport system substrate-binding protein